MNTMHYKGYIARIEYSEEDNCLIGHLAGIGDVVGFHGHSVEELHQAFKEAVNDYLEVCKKMKRPPHKHYSGKLMLRIPPEVHAKAALQAEMQGKSLNAWVAELLGKAHQQRVESI